MNKQSYMELDLVMNKYGYADKFPGTQEYIARFGEEKLKSEPDFGCIEVYADVCEILTDNSITQPQVIQALLKCLVAVIRLGYRDEYDNKLQELLVNLCINTSLMYEETYFHDSDEEIVHFLQYDFE